ncbi:signal peptide peptidase-domain-containing protein [Xylariomycetidae sp. FL0641]|nr:signal peptide peptidase-domain-containing protein [Xylariomycetidae sp. FL0641]
MASNNSTILVPDELSVANLTSSTEFNQTILERLANTPTVLMQNKGLLTLELQIVFTSLFLIYIGAHAALRRPPSATAPKKRKQGGKDTEEPDDPVIEGMTPSDVIMLPLMAGAALMGLYYLIKWLEDPDILNKCLRIYFSIMAVASGGKLFADAFQFFIGFIFPTVWTAKDGKLWHVDPVKKSHWSSIGDSTDRFWDDRKKTPLPGTWSEMGLSESKSAWLWEVRRLLLDQWTVRLSVHGIANEKIHVKFLDMLGVVAAVGANMIYYTTESNFLSNVIGYAFSYSGVILLSPTTFATGSGVLYGLFFYDIYMVFYTPYMVTVATKLEVPVKLVFEGPKGPSMLGLGDIVVPGMFMALCLRFDNYMYYYRQQKLVPVELKTEDQSSGQKITSKETQRMVVKPEYVNPQGQWGDRYWATKIGRIFSPDATPALKAAAFPKPYFYASLIGYFIAMMVTLAMLLTFKHAQPALLYLVPGVVSAVWLTGAVRGELREMWAYTEDGSLDKADVVVEVDGNGEVIQPVQDGKDDEKKPDDKKDVSPTEDSTSGHASGKEDRETTGDGKDKGNGEDENPHHGTQPVFLFSIEAPASPTDSAR